ncbi:RNA 2',3'-cyclic phosphodiesterase [Nitratidesulfovibrio liaohensis]|uniref:RNA 2',3'-cyclic phosphodiesterase n=1 Tax=Nitratidesulfovibrio liaohensis TaxID=2604158 RepID=A0ABY9R433_9BACT|nr:RNA 2',3'-cyclic phosphodiesterase [Nitratidesulfovibrio liaohensis]WMW66520.1 RNA 2',3'-cyclic phosphodiesterase [Nitratidesulfovibrio liaohensis]
MRPALRARRKRSRARFAVSWACRCPRNGRTGWPRYAPICRRSAPPPIPPTPARATRPSAIPAPPRLAGLADLLHRLHWTPPGNWHLTLRFLGDVPAPRCNEVANALRTISFAPLQLAVGAAGAFPARGAPRVLWLGLAQGAPECTALATAVNAALAPLGFAPEDRPFAPHLTMARVREARRGDRQRDVARSGGEPSYPPSQHLARAAADARDALLAAINARINRAASPWPGCTVREMVLWRSDLGGGRPVHTPLAVLPARG